MPTQPRNGSTLFASGGNKCGQTVAYPATLMRADHLAHQSHPQEGSMADEKHLEVFEDKIIEVGRAQARPVKGEDTLYVRGTFDGPANQRQLCAAVFDGHGGQAASADALKSVGDRLMDQGPPFTDALIASTHRSNGARNTSAPLLRDCRPGLLPGWALF